MKKILRRERRTDGEEYPCAEDDDPDGANLSQGRRQLLNIARAACPKRKIRRPIS